MCTHLIMLGVGADPTLAELSAVLGSLDKHRFVRRHTYNIKCNWKVFADNYLDGGYHIAKVESLARARILTQS